MRRRNFLYAAGLAVSSLLLPWGMAAERPTGERPNIILCMTDDQGWGDVSYNGLKAIKTPSLDDMAARGVRFDRFYAAAPVCSPTRGSVLTGRHPFRYGVLTYGKPIRPEEITVAAILRNAGYATGHFGKWHLNGVSGKGQAIAANDPLNPARFGFDEWLSVSNFFDRDWTFSRQGTPETHRGDGSDVIVEEALKFVDRTASQTKPFLAVVWFGSPHLPHDPLADDLKAAGGSKYYGELVAVDRAMGALRAGLRQRGIAENTIVWFNSDNGAAADGSNGPLRGKKDSLWEGGVRVPGIIEWPAGIKQPFATSVPVCTSDILPTLLELTGTQPPAPARPLDGISLVPLLQGRMAERPAPIGFWNLSWEERNQLKAGAMSKDLGHATFCDNRYKLHRLPEGKYELYDLVADASETKDLATREPEVVARMRAGLSGWQDSVLRSYRGGDYATAATTQP